VAEAITKQYCDMHARGEPLLGRKIARVVTVNGVRVMLEDGTWGLVRASSNKPSLVVVCESPVSENEMRAMFHDIDARLQKFPEVGEYDQRI
jgi:phosphomannomutase/phosphoglucomutase